MTVPTVVRPTPARYSTSRLAAWLAVALLWLAGGSNYLTRTMLTTMRGSVVQAIPMTDAQFGLLTSVFLWFYAAVCPLGGFMADRFSRRRVVGVSMLAWSALTIITSRVTAFEPFLVLRALLGISQAFYVPAGVALVIDYHLGPTRAVASGLHLTGMICGSAIGGVGGWLAERDGWSHAYLAIGVPNLILAVLVFSCLRDAPREGVPVKGAPAEGVRLGRALASLARPGPYYFFVACQILQGAVSWLIIGWMPTLMREQFQMTQGAAGFSALGVLYGAQITGLIGGGLWSDRWSRTNPRARIILPAVTIMAIAPVFWLTALAQHVGVALLSLGLWGLAMGFLGGNMMPIVCLIVDARFRATAIGVLNACTAIAGGFAVYGVGALRDAKLGGTAILACAGFGVLACGYFLWLVNVAARRAEARTVAPA